METDYNYAFTPIWTIWSYVFDSLMNLQQIVSLFRRAGVKILRAIDDAGLSVKEQIGQLSGLTPVLDKALAMIGPDGDVAEIKEDLTSVQTGQYITEYIPHLPMRACRYR